MSEISENSTVRRMVTTAWAANAANIATADPDSPEVRGYAEFGLPSSSPLVTEEQLTRLTRWRDSLNIPANSAFLDGTLLQTVYGLLVNPYAARWVLTPVTLWELTTFMDAVVSFDRLYCVDNPDLDIAGFNRLLGAEVLSAIPDPPDGMLRRLATVAARAGLANMRDLAAKVGASDAFGQETEAVTRGWQAVLGADLPNSSPFDIYAVDLGRALAAFPEGLPDIEAAYYPSALLIDGSAEVAYSSGLSETLDVLARATRVPVTPADQAEPPSLKARQRLAATASYRTHVNQGMANALALPYLPGTVRMPFRRLFVERARQIQDELVTIAVADKTFASQQPSSPLTLPFFTAAVLRQASTRQNVWVQLAHVREQAAPFRRKRAEWDAELQRSEVSPLALKLKAALVDEALKVADVLGATQQVASAAVGVVAHTAIADVPGAIQVGVEAAKGVGRDSAWTRIWRRLFRRDLQFFADTNSQAIALTNAMPQIERLWELPKIGGYQDRFAKATQEIGHLLRDKT